MAGGAGRILVSAKDSIEKERAAQEDSVDVLWRIVNRMHVMLAEKCPQLIIEVLLRLVSRAQIGRHYRKSNTCQQQDLHASQESTSTVQK